MDKDKNVVFVLAPHTDDGELGCGATIAKYIAEGRKVYYIAFSTCSASLPEGLPPDTLATECKEATTSLGIPTERVILFNFEVRYLLFHRQPILEELIKLNRQYRPSTVFLPAKNDIHQDHQVIYAEGMRAFKNCNLLGYELPWNNRDFSPNYFEEVSPNFVTAKWTALQKYHSQKEKKYMQERFVHSLAVVRGVQAGSPLAEAFEVYHLTA